MTNTELELLMARNQLLKESVDLQREHLEWSKQNALESQRRLGDYADKLLRDALKAVIEEMADRNVADSDPRISDAIEQLKKLL